MAVIAVSRWPSTFLSRSTPGISIDGLRCSSKQRAIYARQKRQSILRCWRKGSPKALNSVSRVHKVSCLRKGSRQACAPGLYDITRRVPRRPRRSRRRVHSRAHGRSPLSGWVSMLAWARGDSRQVPPAGSMRVSRKQKDCRRRSCSRIATSRGESRGQTYDPPAAPHSKDERKHPFFAAHYCIGSASTQGRCVSFDRPIRRSHHFSWFMRRSCA